MSIKRKNDVEILSEKIFPKSVCSKVTNPLPNVSSENVRLNVFQITNKTNLTLPYLTNLTSLSLTLPGQPKATFCSPETFSFLKF